MSTLVINRPNGMQIFQYRSVIGAIKLEQKGLKHSRGSVRKQWALHLGLKATAKPDVVIAKLEEKCKELEQAGDLGIKAV